MRFFFVKILTLIVLFLSTIKGEAVENPKIILTTKYGDVKIELFKDIAPNHVNRILELSKAGKYDGVAFHRVIDGFMAQTGDIQHGNTKNKFNAALVGTGGSVLPDLTQEFNNTSHDRGILSMARSQDPNSANSQFFICFEKAPHLDRQYTAFGKVTEGMEFIDKLKKGAPGSGSVSNPDVIVKITVL